VKDAIFFLLNTLLGLVILAFVLRLLLQMVRADFYNPISQAILRLTNPLVIPARRIIPSPWSLLSCSSGLVCWRYGGCKTPSMERPFPEYCLCCCSPCWNCCGCYCGFTFLPFLPMPC
jgi:hypothetical protein